MTLRAPMVTPPSLYGNGWTNTFDAHVISSPGQASVYDIDGARYDYVTSDLNAGYSSVTPDPSPRSHSHSFVIH